LGLDEIHHHILVVVRMIHNLRQQSELLVQLE
jgi:hypothetical protein